MNDIGVALMSLLGVAVGAVLQSWLSRAADASKQHDALRAASYVDFLRAVAAAAHAHDDDELRAAVKSAADAKARIVVYGTRPVVAAMAQFERVGPALNNDRSRHAFSELACAMRPSAQRIAADVVHVVLMGAAASGDRRLAASREETR